MPLYDDDDIIVSGTLHLDELRKKLAMNQYCRRYRKNGECSSDSSATCSTATSLSSIPSNVYLLSSTHGTHSHSKKRSLLLPACLSRQDSNTPSPCNVSPRRAMTPDNCQPLVRSLESGRSLTLLKEDVELLRSSWYKIPDKLLWCERLFLKLFSINGQLKKIMGYDSLSPKELLGNRRFEAHCSRFVGFWETLVDHLSQPDEDEECDCEQRAEKVVNKIREVGYLHCQMPGVTFDAESWLVFKNVILESICAQQTDIKDRRYLVWSKFVSFVISEMKDAFNQGVRSRSHTF